MHTDRKLAREQSKGSKPRQAPPGAAADVLTPAAPVRAKGRPSLDTSREKDVMNSLLNAADQCAAGGELSRVTVRQIAEMASVNQAMINYYFESKDGLFSSLVERSLTDLSRKLAQFLKDLNAGSDLTLENLLEVMEEHFDNRRGPVMMSDGNTAIESATYKVYKNRVARRSYSNVLEIVKTFQRTGQCRADIAPPHAAYVICSLVAFPFLIRPIFNIAFESNLDGEDKRIRRQTIVLLLSPPPTGSG